MATLASTSKQRANPLELLRTLNELAKTGTPAGQPLQTLATAKNSEDVRADSWKGASDAFKAENATPLTAIIKGVTAGIADNKRTKAQKIRDENVAEYQQKITEYEASMKERRAEIEDMLSAEMTVQKQARAFNDAAKAMKYGNGAPIAGLIQADDGMMRTVKRQVGLPAEASIDNVSLVKSQDGIEQVVVTGRLPDGSVVVGQEPIAFRKLIASVAPAYLDEMTAQEAAEAETAAKAQKQQLDMEKTQAEIGKLNTEAERIASGELAPDKRVGVEKTLRDDFQQQSKDFSVVADFYQRGQQGFKEGESGNGSGDMKLVFSYMKVLDPTSVVREGEYANAATVGSVPDNLVKQYNSVLNGAKLGPQARRQIQAALESAFADKARQQQGNEKNYTALAERNRVDPQNIMIGVPAVKDISPTFGQSAPQGAQGWSDAEEARLRELEAKMGGS